MKTARSLAFPALLFPLILYGCGHAAKLPPLKTVESVDLEKYAGKWYEIASFPHRFQKGCECTTAEYGYTPGNPVSVLNTCRRGGAGSPMDRIKGKAFAVPGANNAKLNVQFFWPFKGKYWIILLAPDYSYAAVGHPNRRYLWILSRTRAMDGRTYGRIVKSLAEMGFEVSKLKRTIQDCL